MKLMEKIKIFVFGERIKGEKLPPLKPIKERPFNEKDFFNWCEQLNVSRLHGRQIIHIDNI
jgi:hypothetical protein